jgi:hypothetical protein
MASSANIEIVSSSVPTDQAVVVENATIARPISVPQDWKAMKVGIRYLVSSSAGLHLSGSPRLCLGISSGSTLLGQTGSTFFMGFRTDSNPGWTYNSSSANQREFYSFTAGGFRIIRSGSAVSTSADMIIGATARSERVCGVFKPSVLTVLITKPDFNVYHFKSCFSNASATYAGIDSASFWMDMESTALENLTSTATSSTYSASASHVIDFDKAVVAWNKQSPTASIVVLDFAVSTFPLLYG